MINILKELAQKVLDDDLQDMKESLKARDESLELFQERIAELEMALEDKGWMRLSQNAERQFSREGIKKINKLARIYWLKNPLIKRAVAIQTQYVFGQGVEFKAEDDMVQEIIDDFLNDEKNKAELTSHQARMEKEIELQCFSNIFFCFFINQSTGKTRVRTIPANEIDDIITNPDDSKEPWFYKRKFTDKEFNFRTGDYERTTKTIYYPDWRYRPLESEKIQTIGGDEVRWDNPVYHVAVNKLSDMKFGVSELYAAMDWAKAYKEFLEDWSTIVKALSRFAWQKKVKGGKKKVQNIAKQTATSMGSKEGYRENNFPPTAGSTFVSNDGVKLEPVKTQGATTKAEDGRHLKLMVAAATGIYEHYFGDPSTGNLATAKSMERPMELMFKDRQKLWSDVFENILQFVVRQEAIAPQGRVNGVKIEDEYGELQIEVQDNIEETINVSFPDLLEKNLKDKVDAIVDAATLKGNEPISLPVKRITRMLLEILGEDNVDEIIDDLFPGGEEMPAQGSEVDDIDQEINEMMHESLREIQEVLEVELG